MALTIDRAMVHGYSQEVYRLVAQLDSRFRGSVRVKTGVVGKTWNFERLGPSDLATVTARHSPTNILNPEHSRRRCVFTDKEGSILLDKFDEVKIIIQPQNQYAQNHAEAINRFWDDLIIAAAVGNSVAVDETDATSNVTLASWQSGRQVIATGGLGLTFDKVNQTLRVFNQNEVPYGDRHFAVDAFGLEDLLGETEVGSSDFNTLRAIQNGEMQGRTFMSFQWHLSERLYQVIHAGTGTTHSALAWHKTGLGLAIALDMNMKISERNDLAASPIQVQAFCSAGACRVEEAKVVQVSYIE